MHFVLTGPLGVGKSSLVHALSEHDRSLIPSEFHDLSEQASGIVRYLQHSLKPLDENHIYLSEITLERTFSYLSSGQREAQFILILPPDRQTLERRKLYHLPADHREDHFRILLKALSSLELFDFVVINEHFPLAVDNCLKIISAQRLKGSLASPFVRMLKRELSSISFKHSTAAMIP